MIGEKEMEKIKYEACEFEVIIFEGSDVITDSYDGGDFESDLTL